MQATFATTILYTQLVVGTAATPPQPLWTSPDETAQGFSWAPGQVAFGVPDHDGPCLVEVDTAAPPFVLSPDALWAVSVPFIATAPTVAVGTVLLEQPFTIQPGPYQLVFEARPGGPDHAYRLVVSFVPGGPADFAILKQGPLQSSTVLRRPA